MLKILLVTNGNCQHPFIKKNGKENNNTLIIYQKYREIFAMMQWKLIMHKVYQIFDMARLFMHETRQQNLLKL